MKKIKLKFTKIKYAGKPNGVKEYFGKFTYNKENFEFVIDADGLGLLNYVDSDDDSWNWDEISINHEEDLNIRYLGTRCEDIYKFCDKNHKKEYKKLLFQSILNESQQQFTDLFESEKINFGKNSYKTTKTALMWHMEISGVKIRNSKEVVELLYIPKTVTDFKKLEDDYSLGDKNTKGIMKFKHGLNFIWNCYIDGWEEKLDEMVDKYPDYVSEDEHYVVNYSDLESNMSFYKENFPEIINIYKNIDKILKSDNTHFDIK